MSSEFRNEDEDGSSGITVKDLHNIITEPSNGVFMMPSEAYNEVFVGIYIGEE